MPSDPDLSREDFLAILGAVPDSVVLIDRELHVQYVNTPEKEGFTQDDIRGVSALDFMPPEERDEHEERLLRVLETAEAVSFEIPIVDAAGEKRWHKGTLSPIEREGQVVGIVSVSRDVTARRLAEEEAQTLRQLVPVCSWCRKIRSDEGYWSEIERYVEEQSGSRVTHGMCPDCKWEMRNNGTDGPA